MANEDWRSVEVNPSQRMLRVRDAAFGCIITGTDKARSGYGNGDCLYIDFRHGVFALADGSERHPRSSREILKRLQASLGRNGSPPDADEWRRMINREVYAGQRFQHRTTFSCAALRKEERGLSCVVSHGGDSSVMIIDGIDGSVVFRTGRDMCFAGRSPEIMDVSEICLPVGGCRVVIASDGFDDLYRYCIQHALLPDFGSMVWEWPLERIGDELAAVILRHAGRFEHDDIGFVVFDPHACTTVVPVSILIGGTTPAEEQRFRELSGQSPEERWLPESIWSERIAELEGIGILPSYPSDMMMSHQWEVTHESD